MIGPILERNQNDLRVANAAADKRPMRRRVSGGDE